MNDFLKAAEEVGDQPDELEDTITAEMDDAQEDVASDAERNVRKNDSVARGFLGNSISVDTWGAGRIPTNQLAGPLVTSKVVHVGVPYAGYVEKGTGERGGSTPYEAPDSPPVQEILQWIEAKGITPRLDGPYTTQYELAEAIAFTIVDEGTYAHPFLLPARRKARAQRRHPRAIETAFKKAARRVHV